MRWKVTFTKTVSIELEAASEIEALARASMTDLDSMPIDWEVGDPIAFEPGHDIFDYDPNDSDEVPLDNLLR